jgi:hypothetical protein
MLCVLKKSPVGQLEGAGQSKNWRCDVRRGRLTSPHFMLKNATRRVFSRDSALSVGGSADAGRWRVGVELDFLSLNESSAAAKIGWLRKRFRSARTSSAPI